MLKYTSYLSSHICDKTEKNLKYGKNSKKIIKTRSTKAENWKHHKRPTN